MHVCVVLKHVSSAPPLTSKNKMSWWWRAVLNLTDNVLLFVGHLQHWCLWTANLQSNFAICVLTSVMHVLRNVKGTMLTTAKDAHKHAAAVLKNVEGWLGNRTTLIFLIFLELLLACWSYYHRRLLLTARCIGLSNSHKRHYSCYCSYNSCNCKYSNLGLQL